ncbi:RimK/LysX family protein [Photobacterium sp. CCB-ST2H9]|uniref:ATP-dependent zinc protease family protein n=1 Tax=unclassified Photobacterium TaxID=2628852 RepID=UPI002006CDA0|nr:RimK/LysX family protein [Photobacterium sp. CCB-ST2H9]UTM60114.1 RimK/LysX family protein [Photobacterium sp. CCB-ST2H9]
MNKALIPLMLIVCTLSSPFSLAEEGKSRPQEKKSIVGQVETIKIPDLDMEFLARIDTGANTTSINASNIRVLGEKSDDMRENLGSMVEFTTENEKGEKATYKGKIVKVSKIRNAQGVERRYAVKMDLSWNGEHKRVSVNLRNRSKLEYKLLIGRNWLMGDYLVDVEKSDEDD